MQFTKVVRVVAALDPLEPASDLHIAAEHRLIMPARVLQFDRLFGARAGARAVRHADHGNYLGLSAETVSRASRALERNRIVTFAGVHAAKVIQVAITSPHGESRRDRYVRLTATDTGRGMSTEAQERAFEPFFSTKLGGAGLGLTSVAMIVRRLGGWLEVRHQRHGTRIDIYLPALGPTGLNQ